MTTRQKTSTEIRKQRQRVHEVIGRSGSITGSAFSRNSASYTYDTTITDYAWWDKFRRGMLKGYEFSGLFAKPITQIISGWVLGSGIDASLVTDEVGESVDYTNDVLNRLMKALHGFLGQVVEDLYGLGDQYVIVNLDGSFSVPSPETVDVEHDLLDYRTAVKYTISNKLPNGLEVKDIFTAESRTLRVKTSDKLKAVELRARGFQQISGDEFELVYENLIGRIPIVHFANDRSSNEMRGRPIYEALYRLFSRYNDLLEKMVTGAALLGNPIPTFEGLEDIDGTIAANGSPTNETYTDAQGNERQRYKLSFDKIPAILVPGNGRFKFSGPDIGFTKDLIEALKTMFLLIMEFTRIPDGMWGAELGSARATLVEQMKTFEMYVTSRRALLSGQGTDEVLGMQAKGGLLELVEIWLMIKRLTDPRIVVGAVTITYQPLNEEDKKLLFDKIKHADDTGKLTDVTALDLLGLVADPEAEIEAAKKERAESDPFENSVDTDLLNGNTNNDEEAA